MIRVKGVAEQLSGTLYLTAEYNIFSLTGYVGVYGTKYARMDQVKSFNGCLPQLLFGLFFKTLPHTNPLQKGLRVNGFPCLFCKLKEKTTSVLIRNRKAITGFLKLF